MEPTKAQKQEILHLRKENKTLQEELKRAVNFVHEVKKGNLLARYSGVIPDHPLADSLQLLRTEMANLRAMQQQRNWANEGIAKFAEIIRTRQQDSLHKLFDVIVIKLAEYVGASLGILSVLREDGDDHYLEQISYYACKPDKKAKRRFGISEGMAGQCFSSRKEIYLNKVPKGYLTISSGLGKSKPASVLVMPMLIDTEPLGTIELAFFKELQQFEIDFIKEIGEGLASAYSNIRINERTKQLLTESQQQETQLKEQEAELRKNMSQLYANQQQMHKIQLETEAQTKIINTIAIVSKADVSGDITYVNDEFLKWSKYSRDEVMGKNHRFLKSGDQDDQIFVDLWKTISRGRIWRGEIKNKAKDGSFYWVDAIIAPVLDTNGKPKEYIAQRFVINDKKERETEVNNLLRESQQKEEKLQVNMDAMQVIQNKMQVLIEETEAQTKIINTIAIVSKADVRGDITYVNDEFLKWSKYSREEVIGKNHRFLKSGDQDDAIFVDLWKTISRGRIWRGEIKNKAKDGSFYWVDAIIAPVLDTNGKPKEYIAQRFVINDKKEREAEVNNLLRESQQKEEKLQVNMDAMQVIQNKMQVLIEETEAQTKIINSLAIVSKADLRGNITYVNDEFLKWSKYSRDEVIGKNHRFLKSGDQEDSIFVDLWKTISSGRIWRGEIKNKAKDGSFYWVDAIIAPVLDTNGKPKEYIAQRFVINDKKERETEMNRLLEESQQKEEKLQVNMDEMQVIQNKMQLLIEETEAQTKIINSLAIVSKADIRGDITYVNDEFLKWSKYSRDEVMGKNHRFLKSGDQDDSIFIDLWKTISSGRVWRGEIKNKAKDGSFYWVDAIIAPILGEDGKPKEYIAQRFVINDKKEREEEMRHQNLVNEQAHEKVRKAYDELKLTQDQLVQTEKMAFLGRLTSGVAHEINTPLGAIKASSENVQMALDSIIQRMRKYILSVPREVVPLVFELIDYASSGQKKVLSSSERRNTRKEFVRYLEAAGLAHADVLGEYLVSLGVTDSVNPWMDLLKIENAVEVMGTIDELVSVKNQNQNIGVAVSKASKILFALKKYSHQGQEEEASEFDVAENMETVLAIYANNLKQLEVVKEFAASQRILGYPDELNQVWTNLIHNSIHAMDGKGKITLTIASHPNDEVAIEVTDTGKGIAQQHLNKVFDPFFTTKAPGEGTGLGLSIVKKIIDKHFGRIECESELQKGTTFRVYLPTVRQKT